MAVNQNSIQERLQVLHDYIQRTIDALNDLSSSTRQVVQGLGVQAPRVDAIPTAGLSHTGINTPWQQTQVGYVQTPWGLQQVTLGVNPLLNQQAFAPTAVPSWNQVSGLQHTNHQNVGFQPQMLGQNTMFQFVQTPFGLMQVPVAANPWMHNTGLQHSGVLPQVWGQIPVQAYGLNANVMNPLVGGLQHSTFLRDNMLNTIPVVQTPVTGQTVVGNTII